MTNLSADDPIAMLAANPDRFFGRTTKVCALFALIAVPHEMTPAGVCISVLVPYCCVCPSVAWPCHRLSQCERVPLRVGGKGICCAGAGCDRRDRRAHAAAHRVQAVRERLCAGARLAGDRRAAAAGGDRWELPGLALAQAQQAAAAHLRRRSGALQAMQTGAWAMAHNGAALIVMQALALQHCFNRLAFALVYQCRACELACKIVHSRIYHAAAQGGPEEKRL